LMKGGFGNALCDSLWLHTKAGAATNQSQGMKPAEAVHGCPNAQYRMNLIGWKLIGFYGKRPALAVK